MKRISRQEKSIIILVTLAAIFLAKFPTLYHWLNTPQGYFFPGQTSWFDAWDINFYVAVIRFGERAGMMMQNIYTTMPHQSVFVFQYYTILGIVNRLLHFHPFFLFHLSSIITSIGLIVVCYLLSRMFFQNKIFRIISFITMVLGGGLGWLPGIGVSADKNIAGFTFVNAFERGHDALSTLILFANFILMHKYYMDRKAKYLFLLVVLTGIHLFIHPPFVILYILAAFFIGIRSRIKSRRWDYFSYPALCCLVFLAMYLLFLGQYRDNPAFSSAGITPSIGSLWPIAAGFGILSFFIFWYFIFSSERREEALLVKLFFLTQIVLVLSPFNFSLYFVKGLHVWGVILGLLAIKEIFTKRQHQLTVAMTILFISLITRIYIFDRLMHVNKDNSFFFLTKEEGQALSFMGKMPLDSNILSLYRMGNYIPVWTNNRVYYGHNFLTPNSKESLAEAKSFYTSMDGKKRDEFLARNNIRYIYYGIEEQNIRIKEKLPVNNPFASYPTIYDTPPIIIYKVGSK